MLENTETQNSFQVNHSSSNQLLQVNQSCGNYEMYDLRDKEIKALKK
jgi:hypothetical protein